MLVEEGDVGICNSMASACTRGRAWTMSLEILQDT